MILLMQPMMLAAFFPAKAHCWHMLSLVSPRTCTAFSAKLLSSSQSPAHLSTRSCSSPGAGLCICFGWSSWDSALPISPAWGGPSEWQHNQPSGVSVAPPSSILSVNLLKVHSVSTCKSLLDRLNSVGPCTNPLWYSTSDWRLGGLHATDHNALSWAIFNPLDWGSCHPASNFHLRIWGSYLAWFSGSWYRHLSWRPKLGLCG